MAKTNGFLQSEKIACLVVEALKDLPIYEARLERDLRMTAVIAPEASTGREMLRKGCDEIRFCCRIYSIGARI